MIITSVAITILAVIGAGAVAYNIDKRSGACRYSKHNREYTITISEAYIMTHTPAEIGEYISKLINDIDLKWED